MSLLNFMDFLFTLHFHPLSKPVPLLLHKWTPCQILASGFFSADRRTIHHTVISDWTGLTPCTLRHILSFHSKSSFTISFISFCGGGWRTSKQEDDGLLCLLCIPYSMLLVLLLLFVVGPSSSSSTTMRYSSSSCTQHNFTITTRRRRSRTSRRTQQRDRTSD